MPKYKVSISDNIRQNHIESFEKLSLAERFAWAYKQRVFFMRFMDRSAKRRSKNIRNNGKKYFRI